MLILTKQHKVLFYTDMNSEKALYTERHILKWNLSLVWSNKLFYFPPPGGKHNVQYRNWKVSYCGEHAF